MNNFVCLMSLIFFLSCQGQKGRPENKIIDTTDSLSKEKIVQDEGKTFLEQYIAKYIDSLNNARSETELPQFLNDSQFDYKNRGIWESFHNPISVRDQIINRVNNCKVLQLIIHSRNENFKKKPNVEENLMPPFIELSFYDLVSKRIKSLDCK